MQRQTQEGKKTSRKRRSTLETFWAWERSKSSTEEEKSIKAIWEVDEPGKEVWLFGEKVAEENWGESWEEWI